MAAEIVKLVSAAVDRSRSIASATGPAKFAECSSSTVVSCSRIGSRTDSQAIRGAGFEFIVRHLPCRDRVAVAPSSRSAITYTMSRCLRLLASRSGTSIRSSGIAAAACVRAFVSNGAILHGQRWTRFGLLEGRRSRRSTAGSRVIDGEGSGSSAAVSCALELDAAAGSDAASKQALVAKHWTISRNC